MAGLMREIAEDLKGDLPKYPSLPEYKNNLKELGDMDLKDKSYEEIGMLFYEKAILFQQTFGLNPASEFNTQTFYRARMNLLPEEDTGLIRTYSYPSPSFCWKNGRANLKGKSVFYCSDHAGSAISELRPEAGQVGYLSVWKPRVNRPVKYGICLPVDLRPENQFRFMADGIYKFIAETAEKEAGGKAEHFKFYHEFIARKFCSETEPYLLTSWIANEMLYGPYFKDFIIYPSIANKFYSCNMAFHPNSADCLLRFEKVLKFEVERFQDHIIGMTEMKIGELDGSMMKWRKPYDEELPILMPGGKKIS